MVSLTEKYSDDLKQRLVKRGRIQLDSEEDSEDSDQKRFASIVNIMGISNPVTKDVAGSLFEEQLSRQIYDFVEKPLQDTPGSMMQLTDIYCMYNRARGTALISPDELVNACMLFKKLRLPLKKDAYDEIARHWVRNEWCNGSSTKFAACSKKKCRVNAMRSYGANYRSRHWVNKKKDIGNDAIFYRKIMTKLRL